MKSLGSSGDGFRNWKSPILVSSSREIEISTKIGKQFNHLGDWWIVVDPKTLIHMGWWNLLAPSSWLRTKVLSSPMSWWRERQAWHTNDWNSKVYTRSTMLDCLWISVLCHFWTTPFEEDFFEHVSHVRQFPDTLTSIVQIGLTLQEVMMKCLDFHFFETSIYSIIYIYTLYIIYGSYVYFETHHLISNTFRCFKSPSDSSPHKNSRRQAPRWKS